MKKSSFSFIQAKNYTLNAVGITGRGYTKTANFGCAAHMCAYAQTLIIVANLNNTHQFGRIFRQPRQVKTISHLRFSCHFGCHRQIACDDFIHSILYGLQLLCRSSEEGGARCLGVFETDVRRLPDATADGSRLKVPHVGWNTARCLSGPLFDGLDESTFFYYVHSYAADLCDAAVARTSYGRPFAAALCRDNFYATQFHPEKSGAAGARLLRNFLQR